MGILFGIIAAVCWGLGDYLITQLTRRTGTARALLIIQSMSLVAWTLMLAVSGMPPVASGRVWGLLVATAVCHVIGLVFVYRAFHIGTLSLVSPISSGFAIVTALLAISTGEHPPSMTLAGAGLLIGGVVLAVRTPSYSTHGSTPRLAGVPEALLSVAGFGTMFWLFYFFVQPGLGYTLPLVVLKAAAVGWSALAVFRAPPAPRETIAGTPWRTLALAAGAASADTLAWLAYIAGSRTSFATVVTALASLFSVVTVLLAWRFLRERLAAYQWAGVVAILLGILLVSL